MAPMQLQNESVKGKHLFFVLSTAVLCAHNLMFSLLMSFCLNHFGSISEVRFLRSSLRTPCWVFRSHLTFAVLSEPQLASCKLNPCSASDKVKDSKDKSYRKS